MVGVVLVTEYPVRTQLFSHGHGGRTQNELWVDSMWYKWSEVLFF